jgi:heptosyltransferase-2
VFDVKNDNKGLEFFVEKENEISLNEIGSEKYVAFAIGGQHFTKKLPTNKIIEICNKINFPVVLLGGKEDFEIGEMVSSKSANAINLCGKYNLSQSASIVSKAGLVISHDTGLMHIAAAFKKDILSVWGNTVPVFGMYPYLAGKNSHIFEVENLKCRPCTKIGYEKCPKKHFNCMENQNVEKIAALTNEILTKNIG